MLRRTLLDRYEIAEHHLLKAGNPCSFAAHWLLEDRPVPNKGVEFTPFTTRIDLRWQLGQKRLVIRAINKGGVQDPGVNGRDHGPESGVEHRLG